MQPLTVRGTATRFGIAHCLGDAWVKLAPGAFDSWLESSDAERCQVRISHREDLALPLAGPVRWTSTPYRLTCEFTLQPSPLTSELRRALKWGYFNGLSLGTKNDDADIEELRGDSAEFRVNRSRIRELSFVDWPAMPGATIDSAEPLPWRTSRPVMPAHSGEADRLRAFLRRVGYRHEKPPQPPLPVPRPAAVAPAKPAARPAVQTAASVKQRYTRPIDLRSRVKVYNTRTQLTDDERRRLVAQAEMFPFLSLKGIYT